MNTNSCGPASSTLEAIPAFTRGICSRSFQKFATGIAIFATAIQGIAAPTVAIISPASGTVSGFPTSVSLAVNVSAAPGVVTNVSFYQGATKLADVGNPFTFNWVGAPAGNYAITAVATDNAGLAATSSVVSVRLTNSAAAQAVQQIKTVFVIAMENHNFTQPTPTGNPPQIFGNPAAPYINSLLTPGDPNAAQVSYATRYFGVAQGCHPSEPNYIWAEAGTDFGSHTDDTPSFGSGNLFDAPHLTRQLNAAGISWRNYEEDLEYSSSAITDARGMSATPNPYYGTGEYGYGVKHNPMAFFTDTGLQNVYPLTNLYADLTNRRPGRYNWITPNLFNDMHDALGGGFVYHGVGYSDSQASVAQGDNFLATIIPIIMASAAYQDHGLIIIRWDETEYGDGTNLTIPEIIISPLAKGNGYACNVELNHSSDVRTMDEIFGLNLLQNPIPGNETCATGSGFNDVSSVNDLSDMFQPAKPTSGSTVTGPGGGAISIAGSVLSSGQGFQLILSGTAGQSYSLLASDGLNVPKQQWQVISTGTFTSSNVVFPDLDATNHRNRFYAVKSP